MTESHPFKAFVPPNAKVIIIGSFPGKEHLLFTAEDDKWFYSAKRNQFWTIISKVYNVELSTTKEKKKLFADKGIAIADIFSKVKRTSGNSNDENLEIIEYNDKELKLIFKSGHNQTILFTSKFVEKHFKKLFPVHPSGKYLPSPSPRYATMSIARKVEIYKAHLPH